jgi:hypothetical protein
MVVLPVPWKPFTHICAFIKFFKWLICVFSLTPAGPDRNKFAQLNVSMLTFAYKAHCDKVHIEKNVYLLRLTCTSTCTAAYMYHCQLFRQPCVVAVFMYEEFELQFQWIQELGAV